MAKINFTDYQLTKRTVKATLKKIGMEDKFREDNIYEHPIADAICAHIVTNGTANNKLSASLCIQGIEEAVEEEKKYKEILEKRRATSNHTVKNKSYKVENYDNIEFANECIYEHQWTKENEEIEGYSLIAKELTVIFVNENYKFLDVNKRKQTIQKILLMYFNIVKHMREEGLTYEEIASRYHFKESLKFLEIISKIIEVEAME